MNPQLIVGLAVLCVLASLDTVFFLRSGKTESLPGFTWKWLVVLGVFYGALCSVLIALTFVVIGLDLPIPDHYLIWSFQALWAPFGWVLEWLGKWLF